MDKAFKTLRTIMVHREMVAQRLESLATELRKRAAEHDRSKLSDDEFDGFVQMDEWRSQGRKGEIEAIRGHPAVKKHQKRNSHHPEHHERFEDMGWLDLIEMTIDWHVACKTYSDGDLDRSMEYCRNRFTTFTDEQWWLIGQVWEWLKESA